MAKEATPGLHVIVALTPHEARMLVATIDDAKGDEGWVQATLAEVRDDIMDGLASLSRVRPDLTPSES